VAVQLSSAVQGFVTNFMTAVNPQITKSYAAGDHQYTFSLVRKASRMSYYLLFIFALPLLFSTDFVLDLWLKDVPADTVAFVRLFLVFSLSESLARPMITTLLAHGDIRNYQIIVGGLQLLNLPVSYLLLRMGYPAQTTVVVSIVISQICLLVRLMIMKRQMNFPVGDFLLRVYVNVITVTAASVIVPFMVCGRLPHTLAGEMMSLLVVFLSSGASIYLIGCSADERRYLLSFLFKKHRS
jgi:O-antigen/teichoic acid export membrane protein